MAKVAVCPGFSVKGKAAPDTEKPDPAIVAELTVTAALPIDESVIVWVAAEFTATLPKARLAALMLRAGALMAAVKV
jgi:hypothetical protein